MEQSTKDKIQNIIDENDVLLFMKGTPDAPQCGFSMAVSNMLKKLVKMELVKTAPYQPILLSKKGKKNAEKIVAKHRLIESFLVQIMGFKSSEVHLIAEEIEHINSPVFFRKVKNMLNEKNVDPHGSSIPDIDF